MCRLYPELSKTISGHCINFSPMFFVGQFSICIVYGLIFSPDANSTELYFNPYALDPRGGAALADLKVFSSGGQLPGVYRVDVYLNRTRIVNRDITFVMEGQVLHPQLTVQDLTDFGINTAAFPTLVALGPKGVVTDPGKFIPEATTKFDFSHQKLEILIPQASLNFDARNAVDPALWDQGVPAFLANYNLTGSYSDYDHDGATRSTFLSLRTGANLGAWRLRNNSTYTYTKNDSPDSGNPYTNNESDSAKEQSSQRHWQSINTYVQRDIQRLGGQLTLGENATSGMLFDSIQYRGVQLISDESMLPDSQRGFAPVIRGIANSSAQITIRQNGYVIYQVYVAPGPYDIRDLYSTAGSGDLQITVKEENGSEHTYTQPYSSVPLMQRDGHLRYEFTTGQYRAQQSHTNEPGFVQSSLVYGLSNTTTIYGGLTGSQDYSSGLIGIGQGLGNFGSVSFDISQANTRLQDNSQHRGQSYRFQYAKDVFQSGTTFALAGYRYSTSGFYDFNEANEITLNDDDTWRRLSNKRNKIQVQISQSMGEYGNLYINAYQQGYWGQSGHERNLSAGYNLNLQGVNVGLSTTNTQTPDNGGSEWQYALTVQIPLDRFLSNSWATFGTQTDSHNRTTQNITLNGQTLDNRNLNYAVRESYGNQGQGNGGGANLIYKGTYGNVQTGYSYTRSSQQYNAGLQGGILIHPYGMTLSQPFGETVTLVRAPGASGVKIQNQQGVRTDWRGYTIVPYTTTYRENRIALVPDSLGNNVDITDTVKTVIPTRGAVVLADYKTRSGSRVLATLRTEDQFVPFGATAILMDDNNALDENISSGIVGENGELYLTGVPDEARLRITWGETGNQMCDATLILDRVPSAGGIKIVSALCRSHTRENK